MKTIVILKDQSHKTGETNSPVQLKDNHWANKKGYEVHVATTEEVKNPPFYDFNPKLWLHDLSITYNRPQSHFGKKFPKMVKNFRAFKKSEGLGFFVRRSCHINS
jgi:hypothetical protein